MVAAISGILILSHGIDIDLFEKLTALLHRAERYELDELLLGLFLLFIGISTDLIRLRSPSVNGAGGSWRSTACGRCTSPCRRFTISSTTA